MKSLKTRLMVVMVATLALAAIVAVLIMAVQHRRSTNANAVTLAESSARAAAQLVVSQMATLEDHSKIGLKVAQATGKSLRDSSVIIFGRSAKVLGAVPSKSVKIEFTTDPDCRECHISGIAASPSGIAERADGERVARSIAPINAEISCKQAGCHPSVAKPLGYAYVQIPVELLMDGAFERVIWYLVVTLVLFAAIGYIAYRYAFGQLIWPVTETVEYLRCIAIGEHCQKPTFEPPSELEGVNEKVEKIIARLGEVETRIPQMLEASATSAKVVHRLVGLLARNTDTEREYLWQLEKSLGRLATDIKDVNGSVDLIVASTGDNSANLTDLTGSVKTVAGDAEQLSVQVKRAVGSVGQMCRSVQAVAEHVDLLVSRVDSAAGRVGYIENSATEIAENARKASELTAEMAGSANFGAEAVHIISASIKTSYKEILVAADSMRELKNASRSVGDILKIINEINDKTKLLALNAAIIAAQAGEQGRSFAVVAHEIKSLSDRTASSTGDIARIIEAIQEGVDKALGNVTRGEERIGSSVDAVEQAGTLLAGIADSSADMSNRVRAIGEAAKRQSLLSEEVAESVKQVAGMVDEIKRRVGEHSTSAESVEQAAQTMSVLTEQVKSAAKEQADTSRYLSEAFTIIDVHLKGVLKSFGSNTENISAVLEEINRAKGRLDDCNKAVADTDTALVDLERGFAQLSTLVAQGADNK